MAAAPISGWTRDGQPRFIEVNPLAGIRPGYSDLCFIADFEGLSYQQLIGKFVDAFLARQARMKILVLHSDVAADAPPEEQDTLIAAEAVRAALAGRGHAVSKAAFREESLAALLRARRSGHGVQSGGRGGRQGHSGLHRAAPAGRAGACLSPASGAKAMDVTCDKPLTKRMLREAGLATPDWSVPPDWPGLDGRTYIVKAALEDGSIGLDDGCVVRGPDVKTRAAACAIRFGGRWFAEEYVEGREFNLALLGNTRAFRILPMAEMTFADWPAGKPRIVGYGAKWDEESDRLAPDGAPLRGGKERTGPGRQIESRLRSGVGPVRPDRLCAGGFPGDGNRRTADPGDQRQSLHHAGCRFCRSGGRGRHGL